LATQTVKRPHDIEIYNTPKEDRVGFEAIVRYVNAVGPLVKVELERADHTELIEAELTQERFRELALTSAQHVHIYPRNVSVFLAQ